MGFHMLDLVFIALIGLAIFGPKALQSMARSAGKSVNHAKDLKNKVLAELPVEELSELSRQIPRVPTNPYQAVGMLVAPEEELATKISEEKKDKI
jgi:Sec-independent protein translocase protein TatA